MHKTRMKLHAGPEWHIFHISTTILRISMTCFYAVEVGKRVIVHLEIFCRIMNVE